MMLFDLLMANGVQYVWKNGMLSHGKKPIEYFFESID